MVVFSKAGSVTGIAITCFQMEQNLLHRAVVHRQARQYRVHYRCFNIYIYIFCVCVFHRRNNTQYRFKMTVMTGCLTLITPHNSFWPRYVMSIYKFPVLIMVHFQTLSSSTCVSLPLCAHIWSVLFPIIS